MLERENAHVSGKRMRMFTVASQKNFFSAPSPLREQALLVFLKGGHHCRSSFNGFENLEESDVRGWGLLG